MTQTMHHGRKLISQRIDYHLEQFDATPIHNRVCEADDGDDVITELALAAERAYYAEKATSGRDRGDPVKDAVASGYDDLADAVEHRIDELVAQACANALDHADQWREWGYSDDDIRESKVEARQWLQANPEAAKRVGVWEEVAADV